MKCYNLYYNNVRLNKQPISIDELKKLKCAKSFSKVNYENKTIAKIPFNLIRIIECIIV